jgi:HEAT repeat protein
MSSDRQTGLEQAIEATLSPWKYSSDERCSAAERLAQFKTKEAISALITALGDADPSLRRAALNALIHIGPPAVKQLIKAMGIKNTFVRRGAAHALGDIRSVQAFGPLKRALAREQTWSVRAASAISLGKLGDSRALGPLARALASDSDYNVREAAASALGELGDRRAVRDLKRALKDENPYVRTAAETALIRIERRT